MVFTRDTRNYTFNNRIIMELMQKESFYLPVSFFCWLFFSSYSSSKYLKISSHDLSLKILFLYDSHRLFHKHSLDSMSSHKLTISNFIPVISNFDALENRVFNLLSTFQNKTQKYRHDSEGTAHAHDKTFR